MSVSRTLVNAASQCDEPRERRVAAEQRNTCQVGMLEGNVIRRPSFEMQLTRSYVAPYTVCKVLSRPTEILARPNIQIMTMAMKRNCINSVLMRGVAPMLIL